MKVEFKEDPEKDYYTLIVYYNDEAIGEISRKEYIHFWFFIYGIEDYMLSVTLKESKEKVIKYIESLQIFFNKYFK